jgi:tetratricopeptide (TPR) repeat protein
VTRTAFAEEAGTKIVAIGCVPRKAYEPQGWELWAPVAKLYQAGEYDGAADRARSIADANPRYPFLFYNLACCESLAGPPDDAIGHLQLAIEESEPFRSLAGSDPDFDPIRDLPAFARLVQTGR